METKIDYDAVLADLEERKGYLNDAIVAIKALQLAAGAPKYPTSLEPPVKRGRKQKTVKADDGDLSREWPESENTSCPESKPGAES